jgi:hypothetical protein
MDGALLGSIDVTLGKTKTAALFGMNTECSTPPLPIVGFVSFAASASWIARLSRIAVARNRARPLGQFWRSAPVEDRADQKACRSMPEVVTGPNSIAVKTHCAGPSGKRLRG